MTHRLELMLVTALALVLVDCKHAPSETAADPTPVANCLALLDSDDSLTMDTPFVATGPVITYDGEPVPAAEFRRFSMLYADAMAPRSPDAVVEAFAVYWTGKMLADTAGVEVTRGQIDARFDTIAGRFPDDASFERFLEDAGMTTQKLRAAVCRDLRLEAYALQQTGEQIGTESVREAFERGAFPGLSDSSVPFDAAKPLIRNALTAEAITPNTVALLEAARADRTAPVSGSQVTTSLREDYTTPLTGDFTGLVYDNGTWTAGFYFDAGHMMDGLEHERLLLLRDSENRIRLKSRSYPRVLYLADDRVILSAPQDDEPNTLVRVEGDAAELSAKNYSGSTWLRPLGTLPLTYIDVRRRGDMVTPAVTPRGKALGQRLVYDCATAGAASCVDATFSIDVLGTEQAETWAIFEYPPVDGERVYTRNCATCHGSDGRGLDKTHPPLVGTRWSTGLLGDRALIESVALGTDAESLAGETTINGETFQSELMPAFVEHLEPRQVHAAVNYIARSWGNDGPQVTEQQVIDVYCENGIDVVYRARASDARMERLIDQARQKGDCGAEVRAEIESLDEPVPDDLMERAERLYEANCSVCHGANGGGDSPVGAALQPAATDFSDPDDWNHGRSVAGAYLSIAHGNAGTAMSFYSGTFDHEELQALAQLSVSWLPEGARNTAFDSEPVLAHCRAETERRRLKWDRCASRAGR